MTDYQISDGWRLEPGVVEYTHHDKEAIRTLLLGHRIEKIDDHHLRLDNGTVMRVIGNGPECACSAGDYELTDLNAVDNIITAVEFVDSPTGDWFGTPDDEGFYEVFVVAEDKYIRLLRVEGDDGNGYYGTGYQIRVRPVLGEGAEPGGDQ